MKRLLGLFTILAVTLLPFCGLRASAVTNGSATQRFTTNASPPIIVYGLVGAYRCSLVFGTSTSGSTGPIDVQGGYNGTFGNVTVNDVGGTPHTSPFTPTMNAQYYFGVTAFDTVKIIPDASWSGQDATGTLACTPAAVAQATSAPVTIATAALPVAVVNTPNVNILNTPGVTIQNTPGFICISGCGSGGAGATIPPELSTTSPLPVATSLPVIGQNYFWNGTGWIAVTASSPLPVTTAAPVATVFLVNTPGVVCISGCAGGVPTPYATATLGMAATAAPVNIAQEECVVPAGGTPNATAGNVIAAQCNAAGQRLVHDPAPVFTALQSVTTPAPVATIFIVNTPAVNQGTSPWVVNTIAPFNAPAATASPNGAPTPMQFLPVADCAPTATVVTCETITAGVVSVSTINPALPAPQVTWPVSTAAPCATPNCNQVDWQGTSPWVVSTPTAAAEPTATVGVAPPAAAVQDQAKMLCQFDNSTGIAITPGNEHVVECNKFGVIATGLCTNNLPCTQPVGDTTITCAVTTVKTQCIAAPAAGQTRIVAMFALGEESATGGIMEIITGTGSNCNAVVSTIPILAVGASFTANQQVALAGVPVLNAGNANEVCVVMTAGTVTTASITLTYTTTLAF